MGEIAPEEQFLPLSTIFYYLMLDFYVETGIRFFFEIRRLFEITEVEITRVDCTMVCPAVRRDNPRALASRLSPVQVDKPWYNYFILPSSVYTESNN